MTPTSLLRIASVARKAAIRASKGSSNNRVSNTSLGLVRDVTRLSAAGSGAGRLPTNVPWPT